MKKKFALFLVILLLFAIDVSAHSGRTDSSGGHMNHSTGEYHYHHGYPEHQHTNGVCPYGNQNAVDTDDSSSSKESFDYKLIFPCICIGYIAVIVYFKTRHK